MNAARIWTAAAAALVAVLAITALAIASRRDGSADSANTNAPGGPAGGARDRLLEIDLDDGDISIEAHPPITGRLVIEVKNVGTRPHELAVIRARRPVSALPVGLHGVDYDLAGELILGEDHSEHEHKHGVELGVPPGEGVRYRTRLPAGRYAVICNLPGHYLAGERAEFEVLGSPVGSSDDRAPLGALSESGG